MTIEAIKTTARETCASLRDFKRRLLDRLARISGATSMPLARKQSPSCDEPQSAPPPPRVDRGSLAASAIPQLNSGFFARLPLDVRLLIYEQVWADAGTDQHIVQVRIGSAPVRPRPSRHASAYRELTHFTCVCSAAGESSRKKMGSGGSTEAHWAAKNQFMQPWCPHWGCDSVPVNTDYYLSTSTLQPTITTNVGTKMVWLEGGKGKLQPSSPFLGLLLSCKSAYLEAIVSLYQNICFCFMDYFHLECFLRIVPLEHLRHIRRIHLCDCVSANLFMCQQHTAPRWTAVWSYIPLLEQLQELHIWLLPSCVDRELPEDDLLKIMYHVQVPNFIVEIPTSRDDRPDDDLPEHHEAPFKLIRPVIQFPPKETYQRIM